MTAPLYGEHHRKSWEGKTLFECDRLDCDGRTWLAEYRSELCTGVEGDRHAPSVMEAICDDGRGAAAQAILLTYGDESWRG